MVRSTFTPITFLVTITLISVLISNSWPQETPSTEKNERTNKQLVNSDRSGNPHFEGTPKVRRRMVKGGRTLQGSIYEGLRSDYLLSVTLPWTLGMFAFIILLLVCMRTDGWLYHLFTDDYIPPAVRKRMEEEARRAQGKRAIMERDDNWNEVRKTWETDLTEVTERVKETMPPNLTAT